VSGLRNASPFQAIDVPWVDHEGCEVVIVIVKATFEVDSSGRCRPAEKPSGIRFDDVPYDPKRENSSLRYPSDLCVQKVGTDVVVIGEAVSKTPVQHVDVAVRVLQRTVPLRVHGERVFYRALGRVAIGPAAPFTHKPIVYERAYGGVAEDFSVVEERNLAGVGVAKRAADLVDRPAPQIEHPGHPHTTSRDTHAPVGYGAIPSHWAPRRGYFGTCDDAWKQARMPLAPKDHDHRFNNVAHPTLQFESPLQPGDEFSALRMTEDEFFSFKIPPFAPLVRGVFDGRTVQARPPIDVLLVEPTRRRFELVARAPFPIGRGKEVLREVRVDRDG